MSGPTERLAAFREICASRGLSVTHQRSVIFQTLQELPGHPTPEQVYETVRGTIPELSLATVYKTLHTFIEHGLLQEVSPLKGLMRMETRDDPHHHLVCRVCQAIVDIETDTLDTISLPASLPEGFQAELLRVEVIGVCSRCAQSSQV